MATQYRSIVGGPDLFRIATRLFDGSNQSQLPVEFEIESAGQKWTEQVKLNSAAREDGSGKNWNLTGYNIANGALVKIYYSIHTRRGTMTFE